MDSKQYTVNEVLELQNQRKLLEQRLEVHKQRLAEKQKELDTLFAQEGVKTIEELYEKCVTLNTQMQNYAIKEKQNIDQMKEVCDALDRLL